MDDKIILDLHACVDNLGIVEDGNFLQDIDAPVCLRDILKYLRKESKECEIRRELGHFHLVDHYLIPIIKSCYVDATMFEISVRLLMNLTQPALICFRQEIPTDSVMYTKYLEVDNNLKNFKSTFIDKEFLSVLSGFVNTIFSKEWEDRTEDNHMMVERILIIIRNILYINTSEKDLDRFENDHDHLILALAKTNWFRILIFIGSSNDEERFAFHALEIISLIFREQDAEDMIFKSEIRKVYKSKSDLLFQREFERLNLMEKLSQESVNPRALRYGGSFELTNIKSSIGRPIVYHRDITSMKLDLEKDRKMKRTPKNRLANKIDKPLHKSSDDVISQLREFCQLFLEFSFESLMIAARRFIMNLQIQQDDETYYLWALKFFLKICRINRHDPKYVMSVISTEIFHWVHEQITNCCGKHEKHLAVKMNRKLHLALSAYNELIHFVVWMGHHSNENYKSISNNMKASVFYSEEYINIYPELLKNFNNVMQSRAYLRELVEGTYLLIKMLQDHRSFNMNVIRKHKKKRVKPKKQPKKKKVQLSDMPNDNEEELLEIWSEIESDIKTKLSEEKNAIDRLQDADSVQIFDPLEADTEPVVLVEGEDPIDKQLAKALGLIQANLRMKNAPKAVDILRTAQVFWPNEDRIFSGNESTKLDDELNILKSLMTHKRIYSDEDIIGPVDEEALNNLVENEIDDDDEDEEYNDMIDEVENDNFNESMAQEIMFDFDCYLRKYTHTNVIHSLSLLLEDYGTNPPLTNDCLIRIIHRIGAKMKYYSLFYSLRNLNIFNSFLNDPISKLQEYNELKNLIKYLVKKFLADVKKNNKLFVEILFQRTLYESIDMVTGYEHAEKEKGPWNDDLDEELRRLYEENRNKEQLPGVDIVTSIEAEFSDPMKTRRQLISRLVTLGLINSAKDLKHKSRTRDRNHIDEEPWTEDEHRQLIVLVDEYRQENKPIQYIMNALKATSIDPESVRSRKSVIKKILELNLVEDEEALGIKKRPPGMRRRRKNMEIFAIEPEPNENGYQTDTESEDNKDDESGSNKEDNENDSDNDNEETKFIRDIFKSVEGNIKKDQKSKFPKPPIFKTRRIIDWRGLKYVFCQLSEKDQSWFIYMLGENIDSRNNGIIGTLSLIPLDEDDERALENENIIKMFRLCQFLPPDTSNGLDFWHIPEDMDSKELEYFKNCLTRVTDEDRKNFLKEGEDGNDLSKDDKIIEIQREENISKNEKKFGNATDEESDSNSDEPVVNKSFKSKRILIESDEEDGEEESKKDDEVEISQNNIKRRKLILDDEDDDE